MNCLPNKLLFLFLITGAFSAYSCRPEKPSVSEEQYQATKSKMVEVNRILVHKDQQRIKGYIERQNLDMKETETGLWYTIEVEGIGQPAETGKVVRIAYKVSLLDGTECYDSDRDGVKEFLIGQGGVESGLEEGILLLREGSKAKFIMPPHLAHGLTGDGNRIPARTIIEYDVEVLSIK
jgi:FKBP-type peptidyl-prolyl cis-trans isomerase FkpA